MFDSETLISFVPNPSIMFSKKIAASKPYIIRKKNNKTKQPNLIDVQIRYDM